MTEHDLIDFEKAVEAMRNQWRGENGEGPAFEYTIMRYGPRLVKEYREACGTIAREDLARMWAKMEAK